MLYALKRKIIDKLIEWKTEPNKRNLLVKGARRIGKIFIINEFAKTNYRNYVYINFLLAQPSFMAFII
jgi:predicted AAA+ superfamily ATPase